MQYNLSTAFGRESFKKRCNTLYKKGCVVDLTEKSFRSTSQNSYLHLLLGVVAMDTGERLEYVKERYFKRLVNPDLFVTSKVDKYAGEIEVVRSSADLSKEEMCVAVDRFKKWASDEGMYLPNPGDTEILQEIAAEMGRERVYL